MFHRYFAALFIAGTLSSGASDLTWWRFEGLNKQGVVPDEMGNAHLKPQLQANFEPGLYGNAVRLDQGRPNFSTPSRESVTLTDDFTISCAIRPDWVKQYNVIVWKGDRSKTPEAINYYFGIRDGRLEFKYKDDANHWFSHTAQTPIKVGQWYEVAVYFKQGEVEMVINGVPQKIKGPDEGKAIPTLFANDAPMEVGEGAKSTVRAFQFSGLLDELRFFSGRHLAEGKAAIAAHTERLKAYDERSLLHEAEQNAIAKKARQRRADDYAGFFKQRGGDAPFLVGTLPASLRINKHPEFLEDLKTLGKEAVLSAGRNEYEAVQLIVAGNPERIAKGVEIEVSDLTSEGGERISADQAEWGWIKPVRTESSGVPVDFIGDIPDIVMEGMGAFEVKAADFVPALVRWFIAPGTKPGRYQGMVTIRNAEGEQQVPVSIRVFDFDLPKANSIPVAFTFFESYYAEWYGLETLSDQQKLRIYDFLLKYRVPPNNIYSHDVYPELHLLEKIKDRVNFVTIGTWREEYTPQQAQERVEALGENLKRLEEIGLRKHAYFYGADELHYHVKKRMPSVRQAYQYLHRDFPDLKMMQTSFPKEPYERYFNAWVPYISYFSRDEWLEKLEGLRANGAELWWYVADGPVKPYPNFFVDYPPYDSRIFMMMSYRYHVDGVLYWAINREWRTNLAINAQWPGAQWKPYIYHISEGTKKERNGMGNYVYPGPDGRILPSLRFENLRDGIEDYEYMMLLKAQVERVSKSGKADPALLKAARDLQEVPKDVVVAVNDYNADPAPLMRYREAVAEMIETLQTK